jgi:hypothetical protein
MPSLYHVSSLKKMASQKNFSGWPFKEVIVIKPKVDKG